MRMWMLNITIMCKKHISGEHSEIHKHRKDFEREYSIKGRIEPQVLIQPKDMKNRHDKLAKALNHKSVYTQPDLQNYPTYQKEAKVDKWKSLVELYRRCENCRSIMQRKLSNKIIDKIEKEMLCS